MAPTPSSSTSLAVQAMAMQAAQRLTGLLSVSLFLQTAFVGAWCSFLFVSV